jgi:hypothetical protein
MAELYYPKLLENKEAFPANIFFTFFKRSSTQSSEPEDFIHLYMPEQFGQPNTITWDTFKAGQQLLGAAAGIAGRIIRIFRKIWGRS